MLTPKQSTSQGFRGFRLAGAGLWLLLATVASPLSPLVLAERSETDQGDRHTVGLGDDRVGYESSQFVTNSKAVVQEAGRREPLSAWVINPPLGLPPLPFVLNPAEIDLGRALFFDRRLSINETLSCGMCHIPEQGFTQNELATPVGHLGKGVRRNAPSLYNVAYSANLFLDGREQSLEAQIWSPLLAENEMANASRAAVLAKLDGNKQYRQQFESVYVDGLNERTLGLALAAYQRALLSGDSPFDRWFYRRSNAEDDGIPSETPYSSLAAEGFTLFKARGCASCHQIEDSYALFTDGAFHNTGTGFLQRQRSLTPETIQLAPGVAVVPAVSTETETFEDDGRYEVTGRPSDHWRYRTPSLRNVALTAPYMHDGSLATLEAVVAFYNAGGGGDPHQDPRIRNLQLSQKEQDALVAFLRSLTSDHVDTLVSDARSVAIGERTAGGR